MERESNRKNKSKEVSVEKFYKISKEDIPFTVLPNNVLQKLKDPIALGLWCYMQSLPSDWNFNKKKIRKEFGISEKKFSNVFALLHRLCLIEYRKVHNSKGRIQRHELVIKNGSNLCLEPTSTTTPKSTIVENNCSGKYECIYTKEINYTKENKREEEKPTNTQELNLSNKNTLISMFDEQYLKFQRQLNVECLTDSKCKELFKRKFEKVDVTIEELLQECVMYYAMKPSSQYVSPHRFRAWIKREHVDVYEKKPDNMTHKIYRDLTQEEIGLLSEYKFYQKTQDKSLLSHAKIEQAKNLINFLNSSHNMRHI